MNVCACKWVDEVIIGAPMTVTEDLVKTWDIHVVAKGAGHKRNSGEPKDDPRLWVRLQTFVHSFSFRCPISFLIVSVNGMLAC